MVALGPLHWAYLGGEFLPLSAARISPLDRGFLFADGVYEVIPVYAGRPFLFVEHCTRLARSLDAIRLRIPYDIDRWRAIVGSLIERNGGGDMYVYLQVTRGAEHGRNPAPLPASHTVFAFCAPLPIASAERRRDGIACITASDPRWARCDIKSVALLPNVLLRQQALDAGANEAILLRDGLLTEGTSSTVHAVLDGALVAPPESPRILPGTTRTVVAELARRCGIRYRSAEISAAQLRSAPEILLASALREIDAVTTLDGAAVGSGVPGPCYRQLRAAFDDLKRELRGTSW
ncbi:MAG: aminotransferase class IV [Steroidobacteraceae bacterium]|nr:aminotransferase class IV [Steroidobacteraceae bacterium]MDW8258984.1 aminotransferase class IV [Gammaproteobacteria bacterium]